MPKPVIQVARQGTVHVLIVLVAAELAAFASSTQAQATDEGWTSATPWTGAGGVTRSTKQIMLAQDAADQTATVPHLAVASHNALDRTTLPMNPASPAVSGWDCEPQACSPKANANAKIQTAGPNITTNNQGFGLNFTALTYPDTNIAPPSPSGAAGTTEFLLAANGRIRCFDKATGNLGTLDVNLNVFFDSVRSGKEVRYPRVRFDPLTLRFFVLAATDWGSTATEPNRILLAVSDGATITSSTLWAFFQFRHDEVSPAGGAGCVADFPTLGIDANALYIGVNNYCGLGGTYSGTSAFVVRKSSVLNGGPIVVSAFRNLTNGSAGTGPYTPQGVDNFDAGATQGYFIGVDNGSLGTLMLRRVINPAGTPSISPNVPIAVPATYPPFDVPHKGNSVGPNGHLSAMDDRLSASHIRNGHLWTTHNIGVNSNGIAYNPPSRVAVRWYELGSLDSVPFLVRSGTIYDSTSVNPLSYWCPAIMSTGQARTGFTFNVAGYNSYVDAAAASLLSGGDVQAPARYTNTTYAYDPYFDQGGTQGRRWGQYSSISLDLVDNATLWAVQEFAAGPDIWGVQVTQMLAPGAILDQVVYHACTNQPQANFYLTGSGFYDPGPGFTQPSLAIDGSGVTVTDFHIIDPHTASFSIVLDPDYSRGEHSIIYTSADGQVSTLYNGLFVHGGRADFTGDCRVNADDALVLITCSTGPGVLYNPAALPPGCNLPLTPSNHLPPDFDDDFDIDSHDFALFQRCFTGNDRYISMDFECVWGYP